MTPTNAPTILIIVGITGDLSRRKLLPAIEKIAEAHAAPGQLKIIGVTRQDISKQDVLSSIKSTDSHTFLEENLEMCQMNLSQANDYVTLKNHIEDMEQRLGGSAQRLFYISVPPQISRPIIEHLGESGLSHGHTKLLLEKPFGTDLASAEELITQTTKHFTEDHIYRIDHYLAKEMSQNFVVFRDANYIFKQTWSKDFIEKIEIIASEKIGIEGRAAFYEQTGALRDIVQSHLLQLAALTLMETPEVENIEEVPLRRLKALKQLHVPQDEPLEAFAQRGQYAGYREEVNNDGSVVETFVRVRLQSTDPRWEGVPILLITGKAMDEKSTQIRITYKKDEEHESNQLIINVQPDEGIEFHVWTKVPGYGHHLEKRPLRLSFREDDDNMPEAYEQVFLDAIDSNHSLFTTSEEVLESWRILSPIQEAWGMNADSLKIYQPGSKVQEV